MTYKYLLSYWTMENSDKFYFLHEKKFTKKKLWEQIEDAILQYIQMHPHITDFNWETFMYEKEFIKFLKEAYGFIKIEPQYHESVEYFGWAHASTKEDHPWDAPKWQQKTNTKIYNLLKNRTIKEEDREWF